MAMSQCGIQNATQNMKRAVSGGKLAAQLAMVCPKAQFRVALQRSMRFTAVRSGFPFQPNGAIFFFFLFRVDQWMCSLLPKPLHKATDANFTSSPMMMMSTVANTIFHFEKEKPSILDPRPDRAGERPR